MKIIIEEDIKGTGTVIDITKNAIVIGSGRYDIIICTNAWFEDVFEWVMDDIDWLLPFFGYIQWNVEE